MAAHPESSGETPPAEFEFKAAAFTLPVIRLLGTDMDAVAAQLSAKVDQAPDFFKNTPVVIDLSGLPKGTGEVEFPLLVGLMRGFCMIPIGVRGGTKEQHEAAQAMELAILGDVLARRPRGPSKTSTAPAPASSSKPEAPRPFAPTAGRNAGRNAEYMLVTRPVRSGQRVYAAGGDLSVVAPVSSGAELMADGNVHVYGPLRGRALAGMKGDVTARIFCQDLQAELVSVAGHYRVSENIPADLKGASVQIFLDQEVLRIERL